MRRGKAIGHNPGSAKYRPLQAIRGIRDVELVDVLKCDVCGHSVSSIPGYSTDWNRLMNEARETVRRLTAGPSSAEGRFTAIVQAHERGDFADAIRAMAMLKEQATKELDKLNRHYWPARTPYQMVNADL